MNLYSSNRLKVGSPELDRSSFIEVQTLAEQEALEENGEVIGTQGKKMRALIAISHLYLFHYRFFDVNGLKANLTDEAHCVISPGYFNTVIDDMKCIAPQTQNANFYEANSDLQVIAIEPSKNIIQYHPSARLEDAKLHLSRLSSVDSFTNFFRTFDKKFSRTHASWYLKPYLGAQFENYIQCLAIIQEEYQNCIKLSMNATDTEILLEKTINEYLRQKGERIIDPPNPLLVNFHNKLNEHIADYEKNNTLRPRKHALFQVLNRFEDNAPQYSMEYACRECKCRPYCPLYNWTQFKPEKLARALVGDRNKLWEDMRSKDMVYQPEAFDWRVGIISIIMKSKGAKLSDWSLKEKQVLGEHIADGFEFSMGKLDWHILLFHWLNHVKGLDIINNNLVLEAINDKTAMQKPLDRYAKLTRGEFRVHSAMQSRFLERKVTNTGNATNFIQAMNEQLTSASDGIRTGNHSIYISDILKGYPKITDLEIARQSLTDILFK
jgi:hypothetical protein